jgi:hypothetical protein
MNSGEIKQREAGVVVTKMVEGVEGGSEWQFYVL